MRGKCPAGLERGKHALGDWLSQVTYAINAPLFGIDEGETCPTGGVNMIWGLVGLG